MVAAQGCCGELGSAKGIRIHHYLAELAKPRQVDDDEPERKPKRHPVQIDQMDRALDLIFTAELALRAEGWIDKQASAAIAGTLGQALRLFGPIRASANHIF